MRRFWVSLEVFHDSREGGPKKREIDPPQVVEDSCHKL